MTTALNIAAAAPLGIAEAALHRAAPRINGTYYPGYAFLPATCRPTAA